MEALRKIAHISNNIISFEELKKFNNQDVEVIVLQMDNTAMVKKKFLDFAGILTDEETQNLCSSTDECRQADIDSW